MIFQSAVLSFDTQKYKDKTHPCA